MRSYRSALATGDAESAWACLSQGYRGQVDGGRAAWLQDGSRLSPNVLLAEPDRAVTAERLINGRIGYVLVDTSGVPLPRQVSPFVYFVHEADGWKITSHLDSTFHRELERAIARGEFRLPNP